MPTFPKSAKAVTAVSMPGKSFLLSVLAGVITTLVFTTTFPLYSYYKEATQEKIETFAPMSPKGSVHEETQQTKQLNTIAIMLGIITTVSLLLEDGYYKSKKIGKPSTIARNTKG